VELHVTGGRRGSDQAATQFGGVALEVDEPDALRLAGLGVVRLIAAAQLPMVLGRSPQATFCLDDARVSRSHCRVDWHGGSFQLTDLSYNGTYVRFNDGEIVSLRRGSCTLHGSGVIGLGGSPNDAGTATVQFETLRLGQALPRTPGEWQATRS